MNPRFRSCGKTYREIRGGEVGVNELDLLLAPKREEAIALSEICGGLTGVKCVACPWPFREEDRGTGGLIWVEGGKEAARSGLKRIKKKKKFFLTKRIGKGGSGCVGKERNALFRPCHFR